MLGWDEDRKGEGMGIMVANWDIRFEIIKGMVMVMVMVMVMGMVMGITTSSS